MGYFPKRNLSFAYIFLKLTSLIFNESLPEDVAFSARGQIIFQPRIKLIGYTL